MKAVGYKRALPIEDPQSLLDVDLPEPEPERHDLQVDIKAVSVNPVDTKVRRSTNPPPGEIKVLGWDAAGVVRHVGPGETRGQTERFRSVTNSRSESLRRFSAYHITP